MSERELFEAALEHPAAERGRFLDEACAGDPSQRSGVEALLARHAEAGSFLEKPAMPENNTGPYQPITEGPGTVIGPYKLLQQIGEGGFGIVCMAEQERPVRRMVALKIIKPGMDTAQVIARFESERQALALMDHPNIAKVLDAGATDSGRPYFVMELVKGVSITEFCDKNHLPPEARLKLFIDVCHAIQHAHHKGVIHRDIKPSNVMVTLHDTIPVVKVIDFGVAKATVQKLTERTLFTAYGQMMGTPAYMSPEQAEMSGLDIDTRSDVYSLGVLLYELLTGTTPLGVKQLREAGYAEMQRLIREEPAPRPSTRLSSLGDSATIFAGNRGLDVKPLAQLLAGELDWVVMKALEKDRNRRYGTPGNFAEDINRYLRREVILARPPSTVYQIKKFIQRNKAAALTGAVIAMTLLVGIAGTSYGLFRAEQRRRDAEQARAEESIQRERVSDEQTKTQAALLKSQSSEHKAVLAEQTALRQAADSGCDVAQQLCEKNSVALGLIEFGRALKFAHQAMDADLEDAIRWNIGTWINQTHSLAYTIRTPWAQMRPTAAFHPGGKLLAVGHQLPANDGVQIRLYDAGDGSVRSETLSIAGPKGVYRMAWQPSGENLGIYTRDGRIHIWKPGQSKPAISFPVDVGGKYFDDVTFPQLAFSPDGSRLIAGTSKASSTIFDSLSGHPVEFQLAHDKKPNHDQWAIAVDWSRDGGRLLTGNSSGIVRIWDAKTGKQIRAVNASPTPIQVVRFNADGKRFLCASGYGSGKLQVWDVESGEPVGPPMLHYENLYDASFSPDGLRVFAVDSSREACVWEVGSSRIVGARIWTGGHSTVATFHPNGRQVLSVTGSSLRVWTLGSEMKRSDVSFDDPEEVRLAPYFERYRILAPSVDNPGMKNLFRQLALSPDGSRLIKYSFDAAANSFEMIDAKSYRPIRTIREPGRSAAAYWRPDGREFITASIGGIKIRDSATMEPKATVVATEATSGSFRPDGGRFAIATNDYCLRFFDTATWKRLSPVLSHTNRVLESTYSRDGQVVFTADTVGTTRLWHASTGKRIGPALVGYSPRVCLDNDSFILRNGVRQQAYRMPTPSTGTIAEVSRGIESLTVQQGIVAPEFDPTVATRAPIGPEEAIRSVGQTVTLEMTVRSVGGKTWMYLSSEKEYWLPKNFTVSVKNPTAERLKAMGLNPDKASNVGARIQVVGTVVRYRDAPEIVIEQTEQLKVLTTKSDDDRQ